tara:strand:- start:11244 stop:12107 length:864 start_codon:yes stop_codon:yes gene_type:complete
LLKRVLILGSTGLIGHQIYNYLKNDGNYELHNIAFREKIEKDTIILDARDENNLIEQIKILKPEYIINCIGILISASNKDPQSAIFLNAYMPHRLEALSDKINAKLTHISTDCVFSGSKKEPYIENDYKDGKDTYAKTKGLGEIISDKHLTLRTSVVGPELKTDGEELFHWFMNQEDEISGFTKSIWSGVTTIELAKAVKWSIENNITGLYHLTNNSSITKYELLKLFKKYTKKKIEIKKVDGKDIDKSFIDTRLLLDYEIPTYEKMISDMVDLINDNRSLYFQYKV